MIRTLQRHGLFTLLPWKNNKLYTDKYPLIVALRARSDSESWKNSYDPCSIVCAYDDHETQHDIFQSEQIPKVYACLQMPTAKFRNRLGVFWKFQNQTKTIFIKNVWYSKEPKGFQRNHKGKNVPKENQAEPRQHQKFNPKGAKEQKNHSKSSFFFPLSFFLQHSKNCHGALVGIT